MIATVDKKRYRLSHDCTLDTQDRLWQARDVFQDTSGELDLMLDTNPYENRLYCYSRGDEWSIFNARGTELLIIDTHILQFLSEIRNAIPGR